jgi:predicted DNA-binding transcriptional regulator YafY
VHDPAGWDHPGPATLDHLETIQRAVIEGVQLELGYRGRDAKVSERTVHPLGLVVKNDTWYLIAGTDAGQRTFRVSRVRSAERNGQPAERPDDFDLAVAWSSIVTTVDRQRAPVQVILRTDERLTEVMRYMFGNRVTHGEPDHDGQVEVTLRAQSEWLVARQLAGFSDGIEVVTPDTVREHLAEIGQGLVRRHAG